MRWRGERESSNVEDRRGLPIPGGAGGLGIGTVVVAFVAAWFLGIDPGVLLGMLSGAGAPPRMSGRTSSGNRAPPTGRRDSSSSSSASTPAADSPAPRRARSTARATRSCTST